MSHTRVAAPVSPFVSATFASFCRLKVADFVNLVVGYCRLAGSIE